MELEHEPQPAGPEPRQLGLRAAVDSQAADLDASGIRPVERPEDVQERALPGPRGPENSQYCATPDIEIEALQDLEPSVRQRVALFDAARDKDIIGSPKVRLVMHLYLPLVTAL